METILVTGAAGFIGSHVSEALLSAGHKVVGVDNVNNYYDQANKNRNITLLSAYPGFTFVRGEIGDAHLMESTFQEHAVTYVAHLAARAGVRPSIADPLLYQEVNVRGTLVLLEAARKFPVKNFVITSSSSVYGNSKKVPFREDDTATDFAISPYAATKKATEVLGYSYHHLYGMNINIVRPFTVYGPRGRPDMAPWIFLESTLTGKSIQRFGDGSTRRDYTYIADFVKGFVSAIFTPLGYEIFNLGNSHTVALSEALDIVSSVTGIQPVIKELPMQPGDVEITFADTSKARKLLRYDPQTSFRVGMTWFYEWYKTEILHSKASAQA